MPSPTKPFKFTQTQPIDSDDSKFATLKLFRDGFSLPCWTFAKKNEADATARLYRQFSGMPWVRSLWGLLFERLVLNYLDGIRKECNLPMRGLTNPGKTRWTYRGPIVRSTFDEATVVDKIRSAVENNQPLHLVPSAPNFPAVDSIVYYPTDVLTCIQFAIKSEHPIAVSGLKRIERWLPPGTLSADFRPSRARPWRFIFIVPPDMETTFGLQKLEGDTDEGEWAGKVDQYVLGLAVGSVQNNTRSSAAVVFRRPS